MQTNDQRPTTSDEVGSLKAIVTNSKSFNPNISHGQILQYKVTITGSDFSEPIVAEFDGSAESGVVDNVPAGEGRVILVEAINPNDAVIRNGTTEGVNIRGGEMATTEISMASVPIFANLAEGGSVPNTRFKAKIFSDPADKVFIEDEFGSAVLPLMDVSANNTEISPNASTGIAEFSPPILSAGEHKFTVKNARTGRSTTISVRLTDGSKQKAAPLFSGGSPKFMKFGQAVLEGI